jgi:phage gp29-like protein
MPAVLPHLESIRQRSRFNPLRSLTAQSLAMALEGFEAGDFRQAALLFETIAQRDDTIASVKAKREKSVSNRDWQILTSDNSPEALKQKEILETFWNNITATNAYDRNGIGGIDQLRRQMMECASYRYAIHHIVWKPTLGGITAEFESVPLWFFENRSGKLRFIKDGLGYTGEDMDETEWLVTKGDGLMVAGAIGYYAKRAALQDWLIFSQRFGMPGVLGRTNQAKDSDGGNAMEDAVNAFNNDWTATIFGDDGSSKIELITAAGGASALPFPALIERMDRKLAALWRGADLSSMSAGTGAGDGASLQGGESDIIEADDARLISESLQQVERRVLEWHLGTGVKPLAYFQIILPQAEDMKLKLEAVKTLHGMGVKMSLSDLREAFGLPTPDATEETTITQTTPPPLPELNADAGEWETRLMNFLKTQTP